MVLVKTTLMQDIFSYINNKKSIEVNDQVEMAYLSQLQHKTLNDSNTIREEFIEAGF